MHIAHVTMFYAQRSGGVRRYLDTKHAWFGRQGAHRHSLLVPTQCSDRSAWDADYYALPSPPLPWGHGYRFPVHRAPWRETLIQLAPDIIEAGDPYMTAWAALEAGQHLGIPVVGFYHSDLPRFISMRLGKLGKHLATRYVRRLYAHFDLILAPSQIMVQSLCSLGLTQVVPQPLGAMPLS